MVKQLSGIMLCAAVVAALFSLAGCPAQSGKTDTTAAVTPPPSAAAAGGGMEAALASATYDVQGMTCDHCVQGITDTLKAVPGVKECTVDLASHCAQVAYDPAQVTDAKLIESINALGYTATVAAGGADLHALAGESGCACGKAGGSGECSGECGDPAQAAAGGCGSCPGGACGTTKSGLPAIPAGCERAPYYVEGLEKAEHTEKLIAGLQALAGVEGAYLDVPGGRVVVDYHADTANPKNFESAITAFGLKLSDGPQAKTGAQAEKPKQSKAQDA